MLFYYVQIKDRHDPRSKHQEKQAQQASTEVGALGGGGALRLSAGILGARAP